MSKHDLPHELRCPHARVRLRRIEGNWDDTLDAGEFIFCVRCVSCGTQIRRVEASKYVDLGPETKLGAGVVAHTASPKKVFTNRESAVRCPECRCMNELSVAPTAVSHVCPHCGTAGTIMRTCLGQVEIARIREHGQVTGVEWTVPEEDGP